MYIKYKNIDSIAKITKNNILVCDVVETETVGSSLISRSGHCQ